MKPGYTTTEFWQTLAVHVIGVVLSLVALFGHVVDPSTLTNLVPAFAILASTVAQSVYTHNRTALKASQLSQQK